MTEKPFPQRAVDALDALVDHLSDPEHRPGQREMCRIVATALEAGVHTAIQGPPGLGKTLAYLVPAALYDARVVVSSTTRLLQEQIRTDAWELVASRLHEVTGKRVRIAVLKGKTNYLCGLWLRAIREYRAEEAIEPDAEVSTSQRKPTRLVSGMQQAMAQVAEENRNKVESVRSQLEPRTFDELLDWADNSDSGDQETMPRQLAGSIWRPMTAQSCWNSNKCRRFPLTCHYGKARNEAADADILVVNHPLYSWHLAVDTLPPHDVLVVDDAQDARWQASDVRDFLGSADRQPPTVILTGATLTLERIRRLGLDGECKHLEIQESFHAAEDSLIYLMDSSPRPTSLDWSDHWLTALTEAQALIGEVGGPTLILCPSYEAVDHFHQELSLKADELGIEIFKQKPGPGNTQMLARLATASAPVLVATNSFGQGFNWPGGAPKLVIVERLPFQSPDSPEFIAEANAAAAGGQDPFDDVSVPQAYRMLDAWIGRLLRTTTDRGLVAILDSRLATEEWGLELITATRSIPITTDRDSALAFLRELRSG